MTLCLHHPQVQMGMHHNNKSKLVVGCPCEVHVPLVDYGNLQTEDGHDGVLLAIIAVQQLEQEDAIVFEPVHDVVDNGVGLGPVMDSQGEVALVDGEVCGGLVGPCARNRE